MMLRLARSRLLTAVIVGAGLFGFAATAGVANTGVTVYDGCQNLYSGVIRLLPSQLPPPFDTTCNTTALQPWLKETPISWNQTGPQGIQGIQGLPGSKGADGVSVTSGPPGTNCPNGGAAFFSASAPVYVCNGANGAPGTNGTNGTNGANGTNGVDGVSVTSGPAGSNCPFGGAAFFSASAPVYVCNGAPGANGAAGTNGLDGARGPAGPAGPPGPPGTSVGPPPSDFYAPTVAMFVDGVFAGTLASVDGCTANYVTQTSLDPATGAPTTTTNPQGFLPCNVSLGLDAPAFYNLVKEAINGNPAANVHTVTLAQYISNAVTGSALVIDHAVVTKFTVPPIDITSTGTFLVSAEIQSTTQSVQVSPSPTRPLMLPIREAKSSLMRVTISSVTGTPALATTAPYSWQQPANRTPAGAVGWSLVLGTPQTTSLALAVKDPTALANLRVWQQDTENHVATPRSGSFQFKAPAQGSNKPAITLTFTYNNTLVMTSPVDPLIRASGRYNYAIHADTVSLTVT